jgi:hypothetical protein
MMRILKRKKIKGAIKLPLFTLNTVLRPDSTFF